MLCDDFLDVCYNNEYEPEGRVSRHFQYIYKHCVYILSFYLVQFGEKVEQVQTQSHIQNPTLSFKDIGMIQYLFQTKYKFFLVSFKIGTRTVYK